MKQDEYTTKHNAKEISLRTHRQREVLGYSRERLAELSETSSSFLFDIERGDRGFSAALLTRLVRVPGPPVDHTLFGIEQVTNVSTITDMLSSPGGKYLSELKELLGAYLRAVMIAKKQDD